MRRILISIMFSFVFSSCSLFRLNDTDQITIPEVLVSAEAYNVTTKDKVSLEVGNIVLKTTISVIINGKEEIIQVDNSTKILYCKVGDEINIDYYVHFDEKHEHLTFKLLETKVFGLDWEKKSDLTAFNVDFIVPELPSGKYPITSETRYKVEPQSELFGSSSTGVESISPITSTFLLIVQ